VREAAERAVESVRGAVNIPMGQLRARLSELPRDRDILVVCRSGQRAYMATRVLLHAGFRAQVLSGGMMSRAMLVVTGDTTASHPGGSPAPARPERELQRR